MSSTTTAGDAVTELQTRAREVADRTRTLIINHAIESDPSIPNTLAVSLSRLAGELRGCIGPALARQPEHAANVCELITELTELQQDLREHIIGLRFRALAKIHRSLARLRDFDNVADLLHEAAEEVCHCCDFDRVVISRVRGSMWVPESVCVSAAHDPVVTAELEHFFATNEIPLSPKLLETELARRGAPALITDPLGDPRTFKPLMEVSRTPAYVAAPVMPTGRVIGFIHADCFGSGRELTPFDRDNLWTFAEGFGLIFERIVLLERLAEQRERVKAAFRAAENYIDELCDTEVLLASEDRDSSPVVSTAVGMFSAPESRIDSLLTAREREVLALMVNGARNNQIADQLVVSEGTVKSHVKNICRKLRAANRAEAVSKYLQLVMKQRA